MSHQPRVSKNGLKSPITGADPGDLQKTNQDFKTLTSVGECLRYLERKHIHWWGAKMVRLNTFLDTILSPKKPYKSAMVE